VVADKEETAASPTPAAVVAVANETAAKFPSSESSSPPKEVKFTDEKIDVTPPVSSAVKMFSKVDVKPVKPAVAAKPALLRKPNLKVDASSNGAAALEKPPPSPADVVGEPPVPPEVARTEELIRDLHNKMAELQKRNSQKVVKKSLKQKESFKMLRGGGEFNDFRNRGSQKVFKFIPTSKKDKVTYEDFNAAPVGGVKLSHDGEISRFRVARKNSSSGGDGAVKAGETKQQIKKEDVVVVKEDDVIKITANNKVTSPLPYASSTTTSAFSSASSTVSSSSSASSKSSKSSAFFTQSATANRNSLPSYYKRFVGVNAFKLASADEDKTKL